ncbi:RNA-directed DNA polymerase (Reverse transcriptase), partial [Trifolium medium]|nr:RNA-directed DNA polymerase (Reverse transcriptase) [Trifolium medium]
EFWEGVNGGFMPFLLEFYANGKLVKGSNCTFNALTPKGRQILDGILVANEVVEDTRLRKKELFMFKVDFEKAYDSVEWNYLEVVVLKTGFSSKWMKWIMECDSSASASVLVNVSPTNGFYFGCGLRQGDPLAPFLFSMASNRLNIMMLAAVRGDNLY